jgi:hypothetical protein
MSDNGEEGCRRSRRIESLPRSGSYWKSAMLLSFTVARRTVYEVAIMSILMKLGKEKEQSLTRLRIAAPSHLTCLTLLVHLVMSRKVRSIGT